MKPDWIYNKKKFRVSNSRIFVSYIKDVIITLNDFSLYLHIFKTKVIGKKLSTSNDFVFLFNLQTLTKHLINKNLTTNKWKSNIICNDCK